MPLAGKVVAIAEARQQDELQRLLEREGATVRTCPMFGIYDQPDEATVNLWLDRLIAGQFDWLIFLTGEGLRRLLGFAERGGRRQELIDAVARSNTLTRGPKPATALKEIGLKPTRSATIPTTEGVIQTLAELIQPGQTIGVQLYSASNPTLVDFITTNGAKADTIQPYVYAPKSDATHVVELLHDMDAGKVDVIVFTSAPQVDRLLEVASEHNLTELFRTALGKVFVASVGPVVSQKLESLHLKVDLQPAQGFQMKNLVIQLGRSFS
ncbi:MAG: uroporphyrinogen-III synthase [Zavarzinella sp.]